MRPISTGTPKRPKRKPRQHEIDNEREIALKDESVRRMKGGLGKAATDAHERLVSTPEGRRALRDFRTKFGRDPHQTEKLLDGPKPDSPRIRPGGPAGSFGRGEKPLDYGRAVGRVNYTPEGVERLKGKRRGTVKKGGAVEELARRRARRSFREVLGLKANESDPRKVGAMRTRGVALPERRAKKARRRKVI